MAHEKKLPLCLLFLRITVFLVMLMWTIDKLLRPEHASMVYEKFYFIATLGNVPIYIIAVLELFVITGFLFGIYKKFTYGLILFFHAVSTLSSYNQYLDPYTGSNLLFFAAWPMLAACFTLYLLRDQDNILTLKP